MSVAAINAASDAEAWNMFMQCCTSREWVRRMVASRPYAAAEIVRARADAHWEDLGEADYLEAFEGHPKIGDVDSLKAKYANTKALAAGEQSSVDEASDAIIEALARGNREYEEKFGFIFIVCATGKSALEMSELLQARLANDRETELINAAGEQRRIFQLRLGKLLEGQ